MKVVLIDNGSLEPAAHEALRAAALAIGERAQVHVEALSWKHSNRIPTGSLKDGAAQILAPWMRAQVAAGEREFLFVPFFISAQGAIGSALRSDLEGLQATAGRFEFSFTGGLEEGTALARIVADRVREAAAALGLGKPRVIVVDHGGPSERSALVRNQVASAVASELGGAIAGLSPASMESPDGPGFVFNRPLLDDVLASPGFGTGDVLVAPLFLSPGRHAGPGGDLERIARASEARAPGLRCHFAKLVGSHSIAIETLSRALARALPAAAHP
jgi:sirohydrochlorin ferrochelatase